MRSGRDRSPAAALASLLVSGGVAAERPPGLAALVISACEGAVAIVRAEADMTALELVAGELAAAVSAVC